MASQPVFQFTAHLDEAGSDTWRRFQVMNGCPMSKLGCLLLSMFEMTKGLPFSLCVPRQENIAHRGFPELVWSAFPEQERYEIPGPEGFRNGQVLDADIRIAECLKKPGEKLWLEYGAGTPRRVLCTLETILRDPSISGYDLPRVLEGDGYGVVEDSGAVPPSFDLEDTNRRLKRVSRILSELYRYDLPPTCKGQDFLDRKYRKA